MTFRDLLPGQRFIFVDAKGNDAMRWGFEGPWVKTGAGSYANFDQYEAGRLYIAVNRCEPHEPERAGACGGEGDERMTRDESRAMLAVLSVSDGAGIDAALEDGLCCPKCGSRQFETLQRGLLRQDFDGEATGLKWTIDEPLHDTNETVSLSCANRTCRAHLWGEVVD